MHGELIFLLSIKETCKGKVTTFLQSPDPIPDCLQSILAMGESHKQRSLLGTCLLH